MNKEQFIATLHRRLRVIDEKERKDIIDEYINHIDMRMNDGKSEEEAIADFGNIDELINDILAAYKIDSSKVNSDYEMKFNNFLDKAFDGFKRFIGNVTSLDGDSIVKLIFEFFVVLVLLFVVRIFFSFFESLGSSLFRNLLGYGVGNILGGLWELIIHIAYVVIFFVVLVNVIAKRVRHYRTLREGNYRDESIIDDFKDSFHFDQVKESVNTFANSNHSQNDSSFDTSPNQANRNHPYESQNDDSYQNKKDNEYVASSIGSNASSVAMIFVKIFAVMLMIPFICAQIGLYCFLAIMVVFSFQGFTLIGAYLIIIGILAGLGGFTSLIYRFVFKGGAFK